MPWPMPKPSAARDRRRTARRLASATACGSGRPRASRAAIAEASVQPVPCVWRVGHARRLEPVAARRRAAAGPGCRAPPRCPPLSSTCAAPSPCSRGRHRRHLPRGSVAGGSSEQRCGLGQVGRDQASPAAAGARAGRPPPRPAAAGRRPWPPSPGRARPSAARQRRSPSATAAMISGRAEHADLDRVHREVAQHGVHLRAHERRRSMPWMPWHAQRVLRRQRRDHRAAVDAQRREGLQVGLDAGAAAAVGAGDGEGDRASCGPCAFRPGRGRRPGAAGGSPPRHRRP